MAFELLATGCDGGDCPTFRIDRATGTIRVTGYDPAHPNDSEHERDVDIPSDVFAHLVSQLPR